MEALQRHGLISLVPISSTSLTHHLYISSLYTYLHLYFPFLILTSPSTPPPTPLLNHPGEVRTGQKLH